MGVGINEDQYGPVLPAECNSEFFPNAGVVWLVPQCFTLELNGAGVLPSSHPQRNESRTRSSQLTSSTVAFFNKDVRHDPFLSINGRHRPSWESVSIIPFVELDARTSSDVNLFFKWENYILMSSNGQGRRKVLVRPLCQGRVQILLLVPTYSWI